MEKIIIAVFCYKRANKLKEVVESLLTNPECSDMDIVFFSDGYKSNHDKQGVLETREYINSIIGFKSLIKKYRRENLSTGPNFMKGLEFLTTNYERFIVIEDDVVASSNYIRFLLDALDFYKEKKAIFCVTGFVTPIKAKNYIYDTIVYKRFCSSGWASWSSRFTNVIWNERELQRLIDTSPNFMKRLNAEGYDLGRMIKKQISGKISTWDVQLQVHIAENRLKVIYPTVSKTKNIGFDDESTNNFGVDFLKTNIDKSNKRVFKFCEADLIVPNLEKQIKKTFALPTLVTRKLTNEFIKFANLTKKAQQGI
ncbi:hypothetical protein [Mucilaginibacter sp. UYCu711]|uniref:hypothetical protein n=1 Tax=Mucilaginibacter sp. UYCu711 TaxID=3156339 RepID=UPI003D1F1E85